MPDDGNTGEAQSPGQTPEAQGSTGENASQEYVSKAEFDSFLERTKQSQRDVITDRVTKAVKAELAQFSEVVDALSAGGVLKEGVSPDQLKRDQAVNKLVDLMTQSDEPKKPEPEAGSDPLESEAAKLLERHGLSGKEPEIAEYVKQSAGKGMYEFLRGLDEIGGQVSARKKPSAAGIVPESGSPPQKPDLEAEYRKEMLAARGKGMSVGREIKAKYRQRGLNVDGVNLLG